MNTLPAVNPSNIETMDSEQISELLELRHDNVRQAAINLKSHGIITFTESSGKASGGRPKRILHFNKENSIIIAAKLNDKFLSRIVRRWIELEDKPSTPSWVAMLSPEARAAIEDLSSQHTKALAVIEEQKPKVEFVERYCESTGNKSFREVAKQLKIKEPDFRHWLVDNKIMYKLAGEWTAYQNHVDAGRFYVSGGVADNEHAYTTCKFTPKGIEYVGGKLIARECA